MAQVIKRLATPDVETPPIARVVETPITMCNCYSCGSSHHFKHRKTTCLLPQCTSADIHVTHRCLSKLRRVTPRTRMESRSRTCCYRAARRVMKYFFFRLRFQGYASMKCEFVLCSSGLSKRRFCGAGDRVSIATGGKHFSVARGSPTALAVSLHSNPLKLVLFIATRKCGTLTYIIVASSW